MKFINPSALDKIAKSVGDRRVDDMYSEEDWDDIESKIRGEEIESENHFDAALNNEQLVLLGHIDKLVREMSTKLRDKFLEILHEQREGGLPIDKKIIAYLGSCSPYPLLVGI